MQLKQSLAVTTTQLEIDGKVMDVTIIFKSGDLVINGVFFISKRLGHAVFETLVKKGAVDIDLGDLVTRNAHYSFQGIVDLFRQVIEGVVQMRLRSAPSKLEVGKNIHVDKVYFLHNDKVCEGYYVNTVGAETSEGRMIPLKGDAIRYFNELCGTGMAPNAIN